MGATSEAGIAYPFGAPEFTPGFKWGSCFMCIFCRSLFVLFRLAIVLSVLRYTDSSNSSLDLIVVTMYIQLTIMVVVGVE